MSAGTVAVAVDAPQHSGLPGALDYLSDLPLPPGTLVQVPLGKRELLGIVWHAPLRAEGEVSAHALRPVGAVFEGLPPMAPAWLALVDFAASYYQRSVGELALAVLPPELRKLDAPGLAKRLARLIKRLDKPAGAIAAPSPSPVLGDEQRAALAAFETARAAPRP
ncbi:MAG: primosomal protein N', partial [Burkholderiales bacterium PBB5]